MLHFRVTCSSAACVSSNLSPTRSLQSRCFLTHSLYLIYAFCQSARWVSLSSLCLCVCVFRTLCPLGARTTSLSVFHFSLFSHSVLPSLSLSASSRRQSTRATRTTWPLCAPSVWLPTSLCSCSVPARMDARSAPSWWPSSCRNMFPPYPR